MSQGYVKGDPRAVAGGRKGGAVSAARRKLQSVRRWLERFPGTTPEAAREIYEAGYKSGTQAKYQAQKRRSALHGEPERSTNTEVA